MNTPTLLTQYIKQQALLLGFTSCGISRVRALSEHTQNYETWLNQEFHADMNYLQRNKDKRINPALLVEGAKSIVSFTFNYFPQEKQASDEYKIAKYAYGKDYHILLKNKLHELLSNLQKLDPTITGRAFVDSAPVMERAWAVEAGLGWIGKNSLLIVPQKGSFFFLAELILTIDLDYDKPFSDNYCGNCTKCIDACPTKAIVKPRVIDARKCVSYLTIEKKDDLKPGDLQNSNYIFGCDVCQDVCPWNRFSKPQNEFKINQKLTHFGKTDFENLTEEQFKELAKDSPLERVGYPKLKDSIAYVTPK